MISRCFWSQNNTYQRAILASDLHEITRNYTSCGPDLSGGRERGLSHGNLYMTLSHIAILSGSIWKSSEMDVSDHYLSESFGIFEKSFLVVEISCCEYRKILDFPTFSRIWRALICRQLQLCRRPPHMMDSRKKIDFSTF